MQTKPAYSIPQFCEAYGVGRSLVYQEIRSKRLRATKIGRRTLISAEAAQEWLRRHESVAARGEAA
jgi:excisionase family DNA binding protein